nr:hypothetical protein [Ligilactobacillus ruminis]
MQKNGHCVIDFVRHFLNAVLFNQFSQNFIQIYGQTAVFDDFVRNRHFSIEPFTDKAPIFIDLSVNGNDFAKCSTRSLSTSRRDYGQSAVLELFVRKQAKISIKFTDKEPIFDDLSVSKTHFTDKPTFSGDLSVNFCPL